MSNNKIKWLIVTAWKDAVIVAVTPLTTGLTVGELRELIQRVNE